MQACRRFVFALAFCMAVGLLLPHLSLAQDWGGLATVSTTMGINGGRICVGETSRGDLGCPTYAPSITTAGGISATGNISANQFIGDGSLLTGITTLASDRISTSGVTSGATLGAVVADKGTVSFTLAGTAGAAYLHSTAGLVAPAVSTTTGNVMGLILYAAPNDSASAPGHSWVGDTNTGMFRPSADTLAFSTGGTERVRVDSSGNIVIGGTTASAPLDLRISTVNQALRTNNNGTHSVLIIPDLGTGGYTNMTVASDTGIIAQGADNTSDIPSLLLSVWKTGIARGIRITSTGIAFNKSTPTTDVDISGTLKATTFSGDGSLLTNVSANTDRISTSGVASGATLGAVVADKGTVSFTLAGTAGAAYLHGTLGLVAPGVSTTGAINGVGLFSSANLGVNRTNTSFNVDISGSDIRLARTSGAVSTSLHFRTDGSNSYINNMNNFVSNGTSGNGTLYITGQNGLSFRYGNTGSTGTEAMAINNVGNIGIGGIVPTTAVEISGTGLRINSTVLYSPYMILSGTTTAAGFTNLSTGLGIKVGSDASTMAEQLHINTNGYTGIGTATPSTTLHVNGSIRLGNDGTTCDANRTGTLRYTSGVFQICDGTGFATIRDTSTTATDTDRLVSSTSSLLMGSGGTASLSSAGGVGINTNGSATGDNFLQLGNGRTGNGFAYIDLVGDATYTDYGLRIIRNNTGANTTTSIQHRGTGALQITTVEAAPITLNTSNTERMRVDSDGQIGIGTSAPNYTLDINGTFHVSSTATGITAGEFDTLNNSTGGTTFNASTNWVRLIPHTATGSYNSLVQSGDSLLAYSGGSQGTGNLVIGPWSSVVGGTGIRINSAGYVGIGMITPTAQLNVSGAITLQGASNALYITDRGNTSLTAIYRSGNYTHIWDNNTGTTNRITLDNATGNVGINTSTPSDTLHVNGSIRVGNDGATCDANRTGTLRYTSGAFQICDGTGFATLYDTSATLPVGSSITNGTTTLAATSGGTATLSNSANGTVFLNMAAGTTSDSAIRMGTGRTGNGFSYIDLVGDATYTTYGLRFIRNNGGPNTSSQILSRGTGGLYLDTLDSAPIVFYTSSTEAMRITASNQVGIGTTAPAATLDVSGAIISRAYNAGSSTTADFSQSNVVYSSAACGAITLSNMQDGGTYTLVLTGSGTGPATFTHSGLTVKTNTTLTCTSAKHTVFSFLRAGSNVYVTMASGY